MLRNLRLAEPTASDQAIEKAIADAGLADYVNSLPDGVETRFSQEDFANLAGGVRQRLNLARAYVKNAPMLLLDEPAFGLDDAADAALVDKLMSLKGKATILMVTHRPSHMRLADRLVYLDQAAWRLMGHQVPFWTGLTAEVKPFLRLFRQDFPQFRCDGRDFSNSRVNVAGLNFRR